MYVSEAVAPIVQSDTRHSRCTDPHPPGFRALINCMDKFSGKLGDNDFEVWVDHFLEATTDCSWDDKQRMQWSSWFLMDPAKATWQRKLGKEDKSSWAKTVQV